MQKENLMLMYKIFSKKPLLDFMMDEQENTWKQIKKLWTFELYIKVVWIIC